MNIDIRTLIIILGITHLMQVLVFYHQYRVNKRYKGIGWWLLWSLSEVIGFGAFLFRGIPEILPLIVIIQNTMIISGTVFLYIGIRKFFDKSNNIKALLPFLVVFMLGFLYSLFIVNDIQIRSWFISSILAIISLFTAYTLFVYKPKSIKAAANFNAIIFLVHAGIFIYRTILIVDGISVTNIFSRDLFNLLPFFDALVVSLLWTFGLIIMLNQRLNVEINEAKEDLQLIFNTSPDAVLITRLNDGVIKDVNSGLLNLTGYSKEEVIGKSTLEINIFKDSRNRQEIVDLLNEKGSIDNFEINLHNKNGSSAFGLLSAKIIEIHNIPHILSVTRDINERKLAEQQIKDKNEELQKINAEKDKFFSIIAHDLKSPFNSIIGFSEVLIEKLIQNDYQGIRKYADVINQSSHRAMNLLMNLMEWAQSQTGRIEFKPESFIINDLIEENVNLFDVIAGQKSINIKTELFANYCVNADKSMINTVLRNLISNAVKFTKQDGEISISTTKNQNKVIVSVKDNGVGIPAESIERLFRIDESYSTYGTNKESGTGLGLILCREFIEKHDEKIWVESQLGVGSCFYFTLSLNSDYEEKIIEKDVLSIEKAKVQPKGLKILIAEDDEISEILLKTIINEICSEILISKTGKKAVEICRNNPDIDLILLDVKMPDLNGYEACKQIREFNKEVIIIAQTAFALTGDKEKALEAGCNDFITKPIKKKLLLEMIDKYFNK